MVLESATGLIQGQVTYCFANGYNISKNYAADIAAAQSGGGGDLNVPISLKPCPVLGAVQEAPIYGGNRTDDDPLDSFGLRPPCTGDLLIDLVAAWDSGHFALR